MQNPDTNELVEQVVARLRAEGAPGGTWLIEIDQAREALRKADDLLRRLAAAIVANHARNESVPL